MGRGRKAGGRGEVVEHFVDRELRFLRVEGLTWKMGAGRGRWREELGVVPRGGAGVVPRGWMSASYGF